MGKTRCYKLKDGTYPDAESNIGSIPTDYLNNTENWLDMTCDWYANGYRLPTEFEWECAARGGTYSVGTPWTYTYSGSNTIGDVAWYTSNSSSHTWEVGLKAANDIGLYDMSGNVREWCWDDYFDDMHSVWFRRLRGGSWSSFDNQSSVSYQSGYIPYERDKYYGFRLACLQF